MKPTRRRTRSTLPESAKIVPAKFLQGETPKITTLEMRPTLAKWMTSADNKFFARAMANRLWYQMFGRGLVNPVDDMHDDNAATHPELLATMTEQLKLNNFDIKYVIRAICNSETYQRTSATKDDAGDLDPDLYVRREVRVLNPEQMYDSLTTILGSNNSRVEGKTTGKKGPTTPRDNFIAFFRVEDVNPLEYQNGIPQALRMMNSPFTAKSDVTANQIIGSTKDAKEAIERIYLAALSRRPTTAEVNRLTAYINRPGSARVASILRRYSLGSVELQRIRGEPLKKTGGRCCSRTSGEGSTAASLARKKPTPRDKHSDSWGLTRNTPTPSFRSHSCSAKR